jgi:hypothetical protein
MLKEFLDIGNEQKLAYTYERNGFKVEKEQFVFKDQSSSNSVLRLDDFSRNYKPTQKPLVIFVHDFPNFDAMYGEDDLAGQYAEQLKKAGFPTLRFHFRGYGDSDGAPEDFCMDTALNDLNNMISWAKNRKGHDRISLIAAGFGAIFALKCYDSTIVVSQSFLWPVLMPMKTKLAEIYSENNRNYMKDNLCVRLGSEVVGFAMAEDIRFVDLNNIIPNIRAKTQIQKGAIDTYSSHDILDNTRKSRPGLTDIATFEDGDHYLLAPEMRSQMIKNTIFFLDKHAYRLPPDYIKKIEI